MNSIIWWSGTHTNDSHRRRRYFVEDLLVDEVLGADFTRARRAGHGPHAGTSEMM